MWYRLPEVTSPNALLQTIELELAKARAEGYGTLLEGIDQWSKRFQDYFAQVHFGKFLILWSVGWTIALAHRPGVPHGIIVRLFVILVAITYWITVNLVLAAYSIEQTTYAKVNATVALLTLEGKDEISAHDERRTRIDSSIQSTYPNHAWWWLQINSLQSLHTLRDVDLQRAIGRRQAGGPR